MHGHGGRTSWALCIVRWPRAELREILFDLVERRLRAVRRQVYLGGPVLRGLLGGLNARDDH